MTHERRADAEVPDSCPPSPDHQIAQGGAARERVGLERMAKLTSTGPTGPTGPTVLGRREISGDIIRYQGGGPRA